jgi:uncharacterized membrane protein YdjX (TVP38/TMEM64 family)
MSKRAVTIAALLVGLAIFFALDLQQYLRFSALKQSHAHLVGLYREQPALFVVAFMAIHVSALALCLPGAVLTVALAAGAIFGTALGTLIVLTSLTVGDSLGFLAARFLVGDWVRDRFAAQLGRVEDELERNAAFYLLSLRLMAAMPYFVVNLTFGVTRMRLRVFAPVSLIGLIPATALYVNAGTELASIASPRDILSTTMITTFALLAILPLVARYFLGGSGRNPSHPGDR